MTAARHVPARFVPADRIGMEALAGLFNRGYEGYFVPIRLEPAAFASQAEAWDVDLSAARVALADGAPVAFALLGVRGARGWIGGMGVIPEHRGRGLGRLAMEAVLAEARARRLAAIDLEVIEQNTWASRIYEALGFRDRRWLEVWTRPPAAATPPAAGVEVREIRIDEALAAHPAFHAERPPWQRDLPSLERQAGRLTALAVPGPAGPAALAIALAGPQAVSVVDLVASRGAPPGAAAALLAALIARHPGRSLSFVNLPEGDPAGDALRSAGAELRLRQREMTLDL